MSVAVLGDNPQAWLVAAHASASSGDVVRLVDPALPAQRLALEVRYADRTALATIDLSPVLAEADAHVIVAAPEMAQQRSAVRAAIESLAGRVLVLAPGGAGGAIRTGGVFEALHLPVPIIAELTGFPVLGVLAGRTATISSTKRHLPIATTDPSQVGSVIAAVQPYLPDIEPALNTLATSLANTNNVVHPPLAIINATRIESGIPFRFYREGLTQVGARLIRAVDRERLEVTDALGLERVSIETWFRRFYGDQGLTGEDIGAMLGTFEPLASSLGPATLEHRYLTDDVGSGLAVIEAIGHEMAVPMPTISAICDVISTMLGRDLRSGASDVASASLERGRTATTSSNDPASAHASAGSREGS